MQPSSQCSATLSFRLERQGILLAPEPGRPEEALGVLNPTAYEADGKTYLMYRSVAKVPHNFSRLMLAELTCEGDRWQARRLDRIALEPCEPYELLRSRAGGGCEDPRVTRIGGELFLCYTAYGYEHGEEIPRIGMARSMDGLRWDRTGVARFSPLIVGDLVVDLNRVPNKDAMLFPERIGGRYAMLHRPMFAHDLRGQLGPESIWISYSEDLVHWTGHRFVAGPEQPWECLKLGGGAQPIATPGGWLIVYHGVEGKADADPNRRYSAGMMVLDREDPAVVRHRSAEPALAPGTEEEKVGVVNNVVFPEGALLRDGRLTVFYGAADWCIGHASGALPDRF